MTETRFVQQPLSSSHTKAASTKRDIVEIEHSDARVDEKRPACFRGWEPDSWQNYPTLQQPDYPDAAALVDVLTQLAALPPLVTSWEIERLKCELAEAALGRKFLLQGGDCAESFTDCHSPKIASKLKVLLQMSLVMAHGMNKPVIRVGRFAGQYAKPRTEPTETQGDITLPSYRGDLINRAEFSEQGRTPDPQLLLRGYERAALTLNFIRALVDGGFADMHHPELWDVPFEHDSKQGAEYAAIRTRIVESLRFIETIAGRQIGEIRRVDFYTSHEALHLQFEQALTRKVPRREGWYNQAAHFPWIGMRTANPVGGHIEYARGIENPVAVKVGPDISAEQLCEIVLQLNPGNEAGRLTLVHRLGAQRISDTLPKLIAAAASAGKRVLWCCDPMHGNTKRNNAGEKTRSFADIKSEVEQAFEIHRKAGSHLGGVHVELTGENVTECCDHEASPLRGAQPSVDPRLNLEQSLELAMLVARLAR